MSFNNINGPSNQPIIQASQNLGKDGGGGGNTGYMNMRNKKKGENKKEEEEAPVLFEDDIDTFERENKDKKENKILGAISGFIKSKSKNKDTFIHTKEPAIENNENDEPAQENIEVTEEKHNIFSDNVPENYYDDIDT